MTIKSIRDTSNPYTISNVVSKISTFKINLPKKNSIEANGTLQAVMTTDFLLEVVCLQKAMIDEVTAGPGIIIEVAGSGG